MKGREDIRGSTQSRGQKSRLPRARNSPIPSKRSLKYKTAQSISGEIHEPLKLLKMDAVLLFLLNRDELHLKNQCRIWSDLGSSPAVTVSEIRRNK